MICYNDPTTQNLIFTVYKKESYFFTLVKMQTSISTCFYRQLVVLCGSKLESHFSVCVTLVAHTFFSLRGEMNGVYFTDKQSYYENW